MFGEPFWFFTHYGEIERSLSSAMIACAMLGMGGSLSLADFARVFVVWKGFAVGMLLQIVLVPVCAGIFITLLALIPPELHGLAAADMTGIVLGVALIAAMPGGSSSNLLTFIGNGDVALSVALTAITTFVCLVTTPIVIELLIAFQIPGTITIDAFQIVLDIAIFLIAPVLIGMGIGAMLKQRRGRFTSIMVRISLGLLALIIIGSLGAGRLDLPRYGWLGIAAVAGFCLMIQHLSILTARASKLTGRDGLAIIIEVTVKNVLLAILLLTTMFPQSALSAASPAESAIIEAARNGCTYVVLLYGGVSLAAGAISALQRRKRLARAA